MRTLFSWLAAALLLGSPAVRAASWFALDTLGAGGGVTIEADIDSLRQSNARREVTVRVSYPDARKHPGGAWYRSFVATVEFQCDGQQADYRDAVFYAKAKGRGAVTTREDGRLATSEAAAELLPPRNLELLIRAACARPTPAVR
jgi:hypothetical protein